MKNLYRFSRTFLIVWITVLLFIAPFSVKAADTPSSSKIAFLRITADSTGFRLVEVSIVDGALKSPRSGSILKEYNYELVGIDSTVLFKGEFENPLIQRFEYEDPDHPGQILVKVVELPSAELTIRVPVKESMHQLNIYRIEKVSKRGTVQIAKKLVTSISADNMFHKAEK